MLRKGLILPVFLLLCGSCWAQPAESVHFNGPGTVAGRSDLTFQKAKYRVSWVWLHKEEVPCDPYSVPWPDKFGRWGDWPFSSAWLKSKCYRVERSTRYRDFDSRDEAFAFMSEGKTQADLTDWKVEVL
jgi:hypothetical protein